MSSTLRIIVIFAIVTAIIGAATWFYNAGGAGALNTIERQNNEAGEQSDRARSAYDVCIDGGRLWDFRSGKCAGPASNRGD
ncbi:MULTISPECIES: hypothetical protein [unclassified Rhizobium]|uniref:hypothetical protein n=1 Tax=unclassified Rhizobium TaxID=2613769 RepID=UPI001AE2703B|nr:MULTISPECIES: hypothetical protein [unclassified Rhizobium]MBP2462068.1 hypothetical protein [Rhizobium sp. PvP014]MBP2529464.1 hypothetical protein [Rhizobium sp. PvP099]